jgi:ligand-binding sensor domain-containing protein/two-component sensor histidine kinase
MLSILPIKSGRSRLISLLLLMFFFAAAHAERLPLKFYTVADGLPHNEINRIVRDSRGFLWFCTANGLSRFDGYTFTNFGIEQGLPHANVTDFLETSRGEYWVGTDGGMVRFNPRGTPVDRVIYTGAAGASTAMFSVIALDDPDQRANAVTVLLERRDETVWCGTHGGLRRLEDFEDRLRLEPVDVGMPHENPGQLEVRDLLEDKQGSLWVAASSGLYRRWSDGSSARYTRSNGLPDDHLSDLLEDRRGQLWAATLVGGFFQFTADSSHSSPSVVRSYTAKDGLTTDWIFQLFETSTGELKIATNKGLAEFYPDGPKGGRALRLYTTDNGLSYREIIALGEDSGGDLWLGTTSGAMKLTRDGFVSYGEGDGVMWVGTILQDKAGGVCLRGEVLGDQHATVFEGGALNRIASENTKAWPQLGRYDGQHFTWFSPNAIESYYGWFAEGVMLQARNGEWWIGTGTGIYRFAPADDFTRIKGARPLAHYTTANKLAAPQVFKLFEDSRGDIWVSTAGSAINGLARWERATDTWFDLAGTPGLPPLNSERANSIGEDREGDIWVGFRNGVARFQRNSVRFFGANEKLPRGTIERVYSDRSGRLWLTSSRSGLIRIENPGAVDPSFFNYTSAQGLSSNQLDIIVEDLQGNIYVGTSRGLDRLNPSTGRVKHYSTNDGLAPGTTFDALMARDGSLWIGTRQGLSHFTPTADRPSPPPPVFISGLEVAGKKQNISAVGETEFRQDDLAPSQNQLHIEFVGLSFGPGEVLNYQYMLEGADADWGKLTEQRAVTYANLAPGGYRFLVRAINSEGAVTEKPAVIIFTVLRPIWRRWWFICLAAAACGALGFAFYRYRVERIVELANIRTRIATDLHDDVGSGLSQISILSEVIGRRVRDAVDVTEALSTVGSLSRDLVDSMSDIVWAINPGRDRLSDLLHRMRRFASDVFSAQGVDFRLDLPRPGRDIRLGPEMRRELYLIFKEAVNNAARHSGCSAARIVFLVSDGALELSVHDDGMGFDPQRDSEGNGLANMRSRARKLGGELEIVSNKGQGTTVSLIAPLDGRRWFGLRSRRSRS